MATVGDRVGAVCSANDTEVRFFGYGTYAGDEIPPKEAGGFNLGIPNPKIELDNGKAVFGCECWWGSEEKVIAMIGDRKIVVVDIDAKRAENSQNEST